MIERVLPLVVMVLLGVVVGVLRLFAEPDRAIGTLNRYALYVAFPPLIASAVASDALALPQGPGFWMAHALGFAVMVGVGLALGRATAPPGADRGVTAFAVLYGNIAYLGIPFCAAALGDAAEGLAALSAAVHATLGMTIGVAVLLASRGDGSHGVSSALAGAARQPLVWAPLAGLLLRGAPADARAMVVDVMAPIGASAGPVALVLLGLYLHTHARAVFGAGRRTLLVVAAKLLMYPVVAVAVASIVPWPLTGLERAVFVLQAGMPVGITAFALAEAYDGGQEMTAAAIVVSTLIAGVTLPMLVGSLG